MLSLESLARRVYLVPSHDTLPFLFASNLCGPFSYQRIAEARAPGLSYEQHQHSCPSWKHNHPEKSVVARPPTPPSKKYRTMSRPTTAPKPAGIPEVVRESTATGIPRVRSQSATESERPVTRGVKSTAVKLPNVRLDVAETLWWLSRAVCRQRLGVDIALSPRREGGDENIYPAMTPVRPYRDT